MLFSLFFPPCANTFVTGFKPIPLAASGTGNAVRRVGGVLGRTNGYSGEMPAFRLPLPHGWPPGSHSRGPGGISGS